MPAGPLGTRHVGLYTPPYAIPSRSAVQGGGVEFAKFLCAPEQMLDDVRQSGFVEVARDSLLGDPEFAGRFRPELLSHRRPDPPVRPRRTSGDQLRDGGRQPHRR